MSETDPFWAFCHVIFGEEGYQRDIMFQMDLSLFKRIIPFPRFKFLQKHLLFRTFSEPLLPQVQNGVKGSNPSSSRQPVKRLTLLTVGIVFCQIFCEITKQVSNYSIKYYNDGIYPLPQTAIVVLVETIKLLVTIARAGGTCTEPYLGFASELTFKPFLL